MAERDAVRKVLRDYNRLHGCGLTLQEMDDLAERIAALDATPITPEQGSPS